MYATWPCPQPDGRSGEEMVLGFDKARKLRLLVIPPLFEEANKFRHQVTEIMRRLDEAGVDCFCPDLPGCNESLAPFAAQTLAGWREAATRASAYFSATHVLALRAGCWLAPESLPGWLYAPAKPATVLRTMLRARALAAREAGREENANDLLAQARTEGIELAGWSLGAALVTELEREEFAPSAKHAVIEQDDVGGQPLWLRAENDYDAKQADALVAILARGMTQA